MRGASLKPDAAIFEHALERLGASAAETVFVDDQARYLDGARALGIATAQIVRTPSLRRAVREGRAPGAHDDAQPIIG